MNFRTWQPDVPNSVRVAPAPAEPPTRHLIEVDPLFDFVDELALQTFWFPRARERAE